MTIPKNIIKHFTKLEKHFIWPLQSNKIRKVLPLVDIIQSVDSIKLMERINEVAEELNKPISFCIEVNISDDSAKHGVSPTKLNELIQNYLYKDYTHIKLTGLMTIGAQNELEERAKYFSKFKNLFDRINQEYFSKSPLTILSM